MILNSKITLTRYITILIIAVLALAAVVLLGCDNAIDLHEPHRSPVIVNTHSNPDGTRRFHDMRDEIYFKRKL